MSNETLSHIKLPQGYSIRPVQNADQESMAQVIQQAWTQLCKQTGTTSDLEDIDEARGLMKWEMHDASSISGWVITCGEEIVGLGFLCKYSEKVHGVEIIAVSPYHQGKSLGRILMNLVIQQSTAPSLRLTQDSFNTAAFSLYLDCGFDAVEYMCCVERHQPPSSNSPKKRDTLTINHNNTSLTLRPMTQSDLESVDALFQECNDCSRYKETRDFLSETQDPSKAVPYVLMDGNNLVAFTTGFNHEGYTVAKTEDLLKLLIQNFSVVDSSFLCYVSSIRYPQLTRWLLHDKKTHKLHRNVTLMCKGWFSPPKYVYLPSIVW